MNLADRRPTDREDVLLEFAVAEVVSPCLGPGFARAVGDEFRLERLQTLPISEWTENDRAAAIRGVLGTRPGYADVVADRPQEWFSAATPVGELGEVRVIDHRPFVDIARSRRLADFVEALDEGADTQGDDFGEKYHKLRPVFDPAKMRGRPILVAQTDKGPFVEAEGLGRISCLYSMLRKCESVPSSLAVLVGLGPRIEEWGFFGKDLPAR